MTLPVPLLNGFMFEIWFTAVATIVIALWVLAYAEMSVDK